MQRKKNISKKLKKAIYKNHMVKSFSQNAKSEICKQQYSCVDCKKAIIYGMLLACKGVSEDSISMYTETRDIANFIVDGLIEQTGCIVAIDSTYVGEKMLYTVYVEDKNDVHKIVQHYFGEEFTKENVMYDCFADNCCAVSFLKGLYLVAGNIADPEKDYHMEYNLSNEQIAEDVQYILSQFEVKFKLIARNKNYVLYLKDSLQIEELLTLFGATNSSMQLMNLKIFKDLRNNVNRRANCETANIGKTVNAYIKQSEMIKKITEEKGLEFLSVPLREAAELRLKYPDASLNELVQMSEFKISRSGLNHRLNKICEIASQL